MRRFEVESEQAGDAKHVPMNVKSRLVFLGKQEKREVRSDSPTADAEGLAAETATIWAARS